MNYPVLISFENVRTIAVSDRKIRVFYVDGHRTTLSFKRNHERNLAWEAITGAYTRGERGVSIFCGGHLFSIETTPGGAA